MHRFFPLDYNNRLLVALRVVTRGYSDAGVGYLCSLKNFFWETLGIAPPGFSIKKHNRASTINCPWLTWRVTESVPFKYS